MSEGETGQGANYQVRALTRALDILESFSLTAPELPIGRLAEHTGLPKSTVTRLASILVDRGYLEPGAAAGSYRLGVRVFEVGNVYIQSTSLEVEARPIMQRLAAETRQTANLGVLDRDTVVHLAVVAPNRPVHYWASVGAREQPHYTALGKVLLAGLEPDRLDAYLELPRDRRTAATIVEEADLRAELQRTREQGWAIEDEESNPDIRCISAPVFDRTGAVAAAVSISGLKIEFSNEAMPGYVSAVQAAGREISRRIGGAPRDAAASPKSTT